MLDFPITLPSETLYDELGIDADGGDLVREFLVRETARLTERIRRIKTELLKVQREYPECQSTRDRLEKLQAGEGDPAPVRRLRGELALEEARVLERFPRFKEWLAEKERLELELNELNTSPLHVPEERKKYNRSCPPLELLQIVPHDVGLFADRRSVSDGVRRAVSEFLRAQGLAVPRPSDLDRDDFADDFERCALLDGRETERPERPADE